MACPSGCVNGGALLKPTDKNLKPKDLAIALHNIMTDLTTKSLLPSSDDKLAQAIKECQDPKDRSHLLIDLSAKFKAIEKSFQSQLKW